METFKDFENIHAMLRETVGRRGGYPAYRWLTGDGQPGEVTWEEFYAQVRKVAKALMAFGVQKGDKVAIVSYSCYRWVLTDLAVACIGAVTVGIYQTLPAKDCRYIIRHSDAVLVFVEDHKQLDKLLEIRSEISAVRRVVLFSGENPQNDWILSFEEFTDQGGDVPDGAFTERTAAVATGDVAAIVYTSGTTGVPKGAMLTHDNMTFTAQ
ncbi:MAG: AMP-binding protein, partial [Desulfobacterales bacterium]